MVIQRAKSSLGKSDLDPWIHGMTLNKSLELSGTLQNCQLHNPEYFKILIFGFLSKNKIYFKYGFKREADPQNYTPTEYLDYILSSCSFSNHIVVCNPGGIFLCWYKHSCSTTVLCVSKYVVRLSFPSSAYVSAFIHSVIFL